jgi:hypothetical protein
VEDVETLKREIKSLKIRLSKAETQLQRIKRVCQKCSGLGAYVGRAVVTVDEIERLWTTTIYCTCATGEKSLERRLSSHRQLQAIHRGVSVTQL